VALPFTLKRYLIKAKGRIMEIPKIFHVNGTRNPLQGLVLSFKKKH
jgi:hypothetical protein